MFRGPSGEAETLVVSVRRVLSLAVGTALATAGLVGLSGSASAAPTTLFSSGASHLVPGFYASAATVPTGICFVTFTADGGHGGSDGAPNNGGRGARRSVSRSVAPAVTVRPARAEPEAVGAPRRGRAVVAVARRR